jgi:hypothetical protein
VGLAKSPKISRYGDKYGEYAQEKNITEYLKRWKKQNF